MKKRGFENSEGRRFAQSLSGFVIELLPTGSKRLNLKEIEDAKIDENVISDRQSFYKAYAKELFILKMTYEKTKELEELKKKEMGSKKEEEMVIEGEGK